ncbi:hypothetical protein AB4Z22_42290, partial [Paenibacillus sp. TAF58]
RQPRDDALAGDRVDDLAAGEGGEQPGQLVRAADGELGRDIRSAMVAGAFGLDPLSHRAVEHRTLLVNKTGTDAGVRSEVGVLRGPRAGITYAVSMYFDDATLASRLAVLEGMRTVGLDLLEYVH